MTPHYVLLLPFLYLSQLVVLHSAHQSYQNPKCPMFECGKLGEVGFPFSKTYSSDCGLFALNCTTPEPTVQFHKQGKWYQIDFLNYSAQNIIICDQEVKDHLKSNQCVLLNNFTETVSPFISVSATNTRSVFKCKDEPTSLSPSKFFQGFRNYTGCKDYDLFFYDDERHLPPLPETLSYRCLVVNLTSLESKAFELLKDNETFLWGANFNIKWNITPACLNCYAKGVECQHNPDGTFKCGVSKRPINNKGKKAAIDNKGKKAAIGVGTGIGGIILACIGFWVYQRRKRNKFSGSSNLISRDMSFDSSTKSDLEKGSIYLKTQIFSYKELDEATNHFDSNKELGDGGFGTVYHGKLRDGRVVAVKRLFEHNYKRVEQFMNEIVILSRLRHQYLVSLYGCTEQHSRELLLVYEYVPNGTVADHLHGDRAKAGLLTWPVRMSIAIESADALSYLHASEIIHRDVKTTNILLDNNFHVKVADFGLSRLFPSHVTHVSTAPQGTPGYVDPEYYQCYQLNSKSDVYSFGVVLIELISSKQAVDIGRHRHEINLSNMAINKIQNQALHELVDPSLGYESDDNVRNMITLVAELAFRCLQQENEMRPCMVEALEILRGIQNEGYKKRKNTDEMDTSADCCLLKNSEPLSPDTVTAKWCSKTSTPNTSC